MRLEEFLNSKIPIVEIFSSISGEGISAGDFVTFVRTAGCNLRCSYCDTSYSYDEASAENEFLTPEEILKRLEKEGCKKIICTGGEPLECGKPKRFLPLFLASKGYDVRIETNGSCPLYNEEEIREYFNGKSLSNLFYALDIKSPGSGMAERNIFIENFEKLKAGDELKFIVGSKDDMDYALGVIDEFSDILSERKVIINFSPVFKAINPKEIVDMLKDNNRHFEDKNLRVRLSLQIHKFIWPPEMRGV